ncbi:MAG: Gfo/Idh/MocA family oxidoreductase [Frankiaceae bacterium]
MIDPVRWGFLGAGSIAVTALAPAVHAADGAVLYAAAARDPARAAALGPSGPSYGAYRELLADRNVEAVYISLANDAHRPWSEAALRAGKHVLCEKPLALSAAEVDAVTAVATESGRRLVEASWYRWHPRVRLAQRLLADGAIGTVRHVAAAFAFDGVADGNYRMNPALGGGALYDVGCYAVSAALWAFRDRPPVDVAARLELGSTGVDLRAELVIDFGGGEAEVLAGMSGPAAQSLVIAGERGELELREAPFTAWREQASELWLSTGGRTERIPVPAADAYQLMVTDVSRLIRGEPGVGLPLAESRATAAVLDAAFASGRAGGAPIAVAFG